MAARRYDKQPSRIDVSLVALRLLLSCIISAFFEPLSTLCTHALTSNCYHTRRAARATINFQITKDSLPSFGAVKTASIAPPFDTISQYESFQPRYLLYLSPKSESPEIRHHLKPAPVSRTFHSFLGLPVELQVKIWKKAIGRPLADDSTKIYYERNLVYGMSVKQSVVLFGSQEVEKIILKPMVFSANGDSIWF